MNRDRNWHSWSDMTDRANSTGTFPEVGEMLLDGIP
jgi:hypothetical protein